MASVNPFRFDPLARFRNPRDVNELLRRPEDFGATPGIVPQGSVQPQGPGSLPSALQTVAAGGSRGAQASSGQVSPAAPTQLSPVDLILSKAGRVGEFLQPVADFGGQLGDSFANSARSGRLAGLAPEFTQGVLAGDQNRRADASADLQKQLIESQIGLNNIRGQTALIGALTPGADIKATTDRGKANADLRNGLITQQQFDSRISEIDSAERRNVTKDATTLRKERDDILKPTSQSLNGVRTAKSLLAAGNPISDLAALTSFIRSIDNSVVRPSEQAAYDAALGFANQIESMIQQAQGQGPVTEQFRAALGASLDAMEENLDIVLESQEQFFVEEAERSNIDPARVTRNVRPPAFEGSEQSSPDISDDDALRDELQKQVDANNELLERLEGR
jgi:hypothetical protein